MTQTSFSAAEVEAVVFDYGNTLIEYGPRQMDRQLELLQETLEDRFGPCDIERLRALRMRQVTDPYRKGFRDNDLEEVSVELVRELYGRTASPEDLAVLVDLRYRVFVESIAVDSEVLQLLEQLRGRYRLALLSNYPCGRAIRDSLERVGLLGFFDPVVVSGEVGWVKPHPKPFQVLLEQLSLPAGACLFVGDNWLADIQGAKRAGMRAVLTTQYVPYESFDPAPGDAEPDARIARLDELAGLLDPGHLA